MKNQKVSITLTQVEYERLTQAAERAKRTVPNYIERVVTLALADDAPVMSKRLNDFLTERLMTHRLSTLNQNGHNNIVPFQP